ncbi:MAG: hypothetical protein JNM85_04950 [Chthonomonas sp.]|nr:hypothetical protein [Chthonomonas sp.]
MTLRGYYDNRIEQIRSEVVRMANVSSEMIELAVEAASSGNASRAEEVIARDDQVDFLEEEVIRNTVLLVMQEMPVAGDLRILTSTLGVIGEIEKVADDAVKLARRAKTVEGKFPGEMRAALIDMGVAARRALASAIRLYTQYEPELAAEVIDGDEEIDTMYAVACHRLVELIQAKPAETDDYLATMEIFHALEHISDRSVAIAKRMRVHYESSSRTS